MAAIQIARFSHFSPTIGIMLFEFNASPLFVLQAVFFLQFKLRLAMRAHRMLSQHLDRCFKNMAVRTGNGKHIDVAEGTASTVIIECVIIAGRQHVIQSADHRRGDQRRLLRPRRVARAVREARASSLAAGGGGGAAAAGGAAAWSGRDGKLRLADRALDLLSRLIGFR